jgi:hypothetical protein
MRAGRKGSGIKAGRSKVSTTWRVAVAGGRNWSGDSRRGLGRQGEAEAPEKEFLVGVWLGVSAQDQGSAVGGWEVDVEHLDCG